MRLESYDLAVIEEFLYIFQIELISRHIVLAHVKNISILIDTMLLP